MTDSKFDFTRRTFGKMLGAAAAVTPGIAAAAPLREETVLSFKSVPLAWPQYHQMGQMLDLPKIGESVMLKREARTPYDETAVAVFTKAGERIGYIPRKHTAALSWALDRGETQDATIVKIAEPVVRGKRISGWGAFHVDVSIAKRAMV